MSDKPKPLTAEQWAVLRIQPKPLYSTAQVNLMAATLDALFRYRERTRGWSAEYNTFSDTIAAEEGIE